MALSEQLRRQLQAVEKMLVVRGKELKVAAMNGMQLSALEELGAKVKGDETFKQMMDRIREAAKQTFAVPANIHAELRPYQQTGYEWMSRLAYWGAGACLADDMGLGKTLQAMPIWRPVRKAPCRRWQRLPVCARPPVIRDSSTQTAYRIEQDTGLPRPRGGVAVEWPSCPGIQSVYEPSGTHPRGPRQTIFRPPK